jgi:hypothetical protein
MLFTVVTPCSDVDIHGTSTFRVRVIYKVFPYIQVRALRSVAAGSSDTRVVSYHITTRCHNPEDLDLNLHRRENLKSPINVVEYYTSLHCKNTQLISSSRQQFYHTSRFGISLRSSQYSPLTRTLVYHKM